MSLVTLDEIKTRLGIPLGDTSQDDFLNYQNEFVSEVIEQYCGRKFNSASYTEEFYYDEVVQKEIPLRRVLLFHYPLISISDIRIDDESVDLACFRTHLEEAKIIRQDEGSNSRINFFQGESKIEIDYDAGYSQVPIIIKEVCLAIIEERYNRDAAGVGMNFGTDVQRVSIPGTISIDFDYTLESNERSRRYGNVIGNHANMLDPYRSERVIIGKIFDTYRS